MIMHDPFLDLYDLPGGKIQEGEMDFAKSFLREIDEETRLKIKVGKLFTTTYFEFPKIKHYNSGKKIFLVVYECFYVSGEVTLDPREHDSYLWVTKDNYLNSVKPGTNIYDLLESYFSLSKV